ncbi:hypothetical protein BU14_0031s0077 [Porphyra umbilicalis]|uniref:Uncharacterized protein n=1 Tax=Porphyra umbilicalis TaxID=2786 RepID=A0A1X6PJM8_PORUM|nr:hypothetical protein BU14_0031s0077 [Porphyra umbilicalis]|eukprot:OSX80908.1 hypothetical protein BU14_0031s0077 [Porphyra umbilicalis]
MGDLVQRGGVGRGRGGQGRRGVDRRPGRQPPALALHRLGGARPTRLSKCRAPARPRSPLPVAPAACPPGATLPRPKAAAPRPLPPPPCAASERYKTPHRRGGRRRTVHRIRHRQSERRACRRCRLDPRCGFPVRPQTPGRRARRLCHCHYPPRLPRRSRRSTGRNRRSGALVAALGQLPATLSWMWRS